MSGMLIPYLTTGTRPHQTKNLPLMLLSQKTVCLVLISTMCRRCDIIGMTTNFYFEPNAMVFPLGTLPKTYSLRSKSDDVRYIKLRTFKLNRQICPVLTVQHYIKRTSPLRLQETNCLFITTQTPFRPASPMTLRRWILTALSAAGIDVSIYSARTTHHASLSKAFHAGVSIDVVLK